MANVQEEGQFTTAGVAMALTGCLFTLACVGGAIASFVFTVIFLVKDEGKGGSCADTAGKAIWVYVIVKTIVGPISSQCFGTSNGDGDGKKESKETNAVSFFCLVATTLSMLIYGGLVLYGSDVCQSYKNTGLYQMYHILYIIDAVAMIILIFAYGATLCMGNYAESSIPTETDGKGINVNGIKNPISLGDGGDSATKQ